MNNCIFCKIVKKELPCFKINENKNCLAFLDINPMVKGHALCIPKKHYETLDEMPKKELEKLIIFTQETAKKIMKTMNTNAYNIIESNKPIAGQVIPHVHFHIIPRKKNDTISFENKRKQTSNKELEKIMKKINDEKQ